MPRYISIELADNVEQESDGLRMVVFHDPDIHFKCAGTFFPVAPGHGQLTPRDLVDIVFELTNIDSDHPAVHGLSDAYRYGHLIGVAGRYAGLRSLSVGDRVTVISEVQNGPGPKFIRHFFRFRCDHTGWTQLATESQPWGYADKR